MGLMQEYILKSRKNQLQNRKCCSASLCALHGSVFPTHFFSFPFPWPGVPTHDPRSAPLSSWPPSQGLPSVWHSDNSRHPSRGCPNLSVQAGVPLCCQQSEMSTSVPLRSAGSFSQNVNEGLEVPHPLLLPRTDITESPFTAAASRAGGGSLCVL